MKTNVSLLDEDYNLLYNSYVVGDRKIYFLDYPTIIKTEAPLPFTSIYFDFLSGGDETGTGSYNLESSKDVLGIYEDYTIYLNGLNDFDDIKRIAYKISKIDSSGNVDENYFNDGFYYFKVNPTDTDWQLYTVYHGDLSVSTGYTNDNVKQFTHNISDTGTYKVFCAISDFNNGIIGQTESEVLTVGDGLSNFADYTLTIKDYSTGEIISDVSLTEYIADETTGEFNYLLDTKIYGSKTFKLISGRYYMFNMSAAGYEPLSEKYLLSGTSKSTSYMFPSDESAGTESNLIFKTYWADAETYDERIIEYVKISLNNDEKIGYSNAAGTYTFYGLTTDETYNYTATKNGYQKITGIITLTETNEIIELQLSKDAEIITPTPTPITSPTNVKESVLFGLQKIFGIENLENTQYILALLIIILPAIIAARITHDGIGFIAGGIIGFVISLGVGLIPLWVFFAMLLCAIAYFVLTKTGGGY